MQTPKGVTVVLIDPQGRAVADATDFQGGGAAGISRKEAQTWRAKRACAADYIKGACNGHLSAVLLDGYPGPEEIVRKLVEKVGYRVHVIEHGYDENV